MVTSDDDKTTDIIVEGDQEEIARMAKVGWRPRARRRLRRSGSSGRCRGRGSRVRGAGARGVANVWEATYH
jgi:hypothetical protein